MGESCPEEKSNAQQSEASDPDSAASESALGVPGILRQQAVQSDEQIPGRAWCQTGRLADRLVAGRSRKERLKRICQIVDVASLDENSAAAVELVDKPFAGGESEGAGCYTDIVVQ